MRVSRVPAVSLLILSLTAATSATRQVPKQVAATPSDAEALFDAVWNQSVTKVQALVARKVDVNVQKPDGQTPLHWAAYKGNVQIIGILLGAGARIEAKLKDGRTPLHSAIDGGLPAVRALLAAKADPNSLDEDSETPLHFAARRGASTIVSALLAGGATADRRNKGGETSLQIASLRGHGATAALLRPQTEWLEYDLMQAIPAATPTRVRELLEKGAKPDRPVWANQATALHLAAAACKTEAVNLMLERTSDAALKDATGATAMHYAAGGGCPAVMDRLQTKGLSLEAQAKQPSSSIYYDGKGTTSYFTPPVTVIRGTPLHWAAHRGHVGAAEWLVQHGAKVDVADEFKWTPLFYASQEGRLEMARYLTSAGAKADRSTPDEGSPLHFAANAIIAELLVSHGADLKATCESYGTPLHMAANRGKKDVVSFLIDKGAAVDALGEMRLGPTDYSKPVTPLWAAAFAGRLDTVQLLVLKGARRDFQAPFDDATTVAVGGTVLHAAAMGGYTALGRYLLSKGVAIDAKGNIPNGRPLASKIDGLTALAVAVRGGHRDMITMLVAAGANPKALDPGGRPVSYWNDDPAVLRLLIKPPVK